MNSFIRKARKSRGFTLVELLIVIIIIGILAGAMLLVAGSSTDKANATKIVSNLRTIKAAALLYYADNNNWPTIGGIGSQLDSYIDRDLTGDPDLTYSFVAGTAGGDIYIQVALANAYAVGGVQTALADMAGKSGLCQDAAGVVYSTGTNVLMVVK
ncbi:MAG: prepilin-type cleavage/methylation domain-containing protein [Dethiosulfovibrio peptidovorans]|nr:MAG: prepilin-type cleavage/methylation domain-containing protein [Dethiosulfovibrio peptidovorans]